MIDNHVLSFFQDDDFEKYNKILEILNNIDFSEIEAEQQFIAENQSLYEAHKNKIVFYRDILG